MKWATIRRLVDKGGYDRILLFNAMIVCAAFRRDSREAGIDVGILEALARDGGNLD